MWQPIELVPLECDLIQIQNKNKVRIPLSLSWSTSEVVNSISDEIVWNGTDNMECDQRQGQLEAMCCGKCLKNRTHFGGRK